MKKIATITTLTAGIGAAYFGTTAHHADAAEFNQSNNQSYNYNTAQTSTSNTTSERSASGNLYTAGQCTWYVYDKVGGKISSNWGNASNWANAAAQDGYNVSNSPKQGAIMQTSQGVFGHVAYVENVNSDGSIKVSEMNYNGGPGNVSTRTISASQAGSYNYIS